MWKRRYTRHHPYTNTQPHEVVEVEKEEEKVVKVKLEEGTAEKICNVEQLAQSMEPQYSEADGRPKQQIGIQYTASNPTREGPKGLTTSGGTVKNLSTEINIGSSRSTATNISNSFGTLSTATGLHRVNSVRSVDVQNSNSLSSYQYWSMVQSLHTAEQQRQIVEAQQRLQQQVAPRLLVPQQNLVLPLYMAGSYQEYERYVSEQRHLSVLPYLPTTPHPPSHLLPMQVEPLNLSMKKPDSRDDDSTLGSSIGSPVSLTTSPPTSAAPPPANCTRPLKPSAPRPTVAVAPSSAQRAELHQQFSSTHPVKPHPTQPGLSSPTPTPTSVLPVKLHPTQPLMAGSLDPDTARMFPHLRSTNMGSIVLWNFLWALLADENYKGIVCWTDRINLKFRVNHPQALARLWGTVKKNLSMTWEKLLRVIELYLSKNILKQGDDKLCFQFMLVPQKTAEGCHT